MEEKKRGIMEKKKQGRKSLARLVLEPLAAGMGVICVVLTVFWALAAYPAARDAGKVWLLCLSILVVLAACAAGMAGLFWFVWRTYLSPLAHAVEEVSLAASGDLTGPADPIPCASREVEALLAAVGELGKQGTVCLDKMEEALKQVAAGDFTARVDCARAQECGGVCAVLDGAVERLRGAIGNVRTALEQLAGPLDVLEQDAAALEESATGQRNAREGLLWSLERLEKQMNSRNGAEGASGAAQMLCRQLEWYGRRQEELAGAIERINECARAAGEIVKAMESTSFRCSVLARTAYVEAAGAGVNGKGFAVVASELRVLASRSAQAAQDAAAFMGEMGRTVKESAALAAASVREAGELAEAGAAVCRKTDGAVRGSGHTDALQAVVRQAAVLDGLAEKDKAKAANAAQTARLVKNRAGRLREALRAFKIN